MSILLPSVSVPLTNLAIWLEVVKMSRWFQITLLLQDCLVKLVKKWIGPFYFWCQDQIQRGGVTRLCQPCLCLMMSWIPIFSPYIFCCWFVEHRIVHYQEIRRRVWFHLSQSSSTKRWSKCSKRSWIRNIYEQPEVQLQSKHHPLCSIDRVPWQRSLGQRYQGRDIRYRGGVSWVSWWQDCWLLQLRRRRWYLEHLLIFHFDLFSHVNASMKELLRAKLASLFKGDVRDEILLNIKKADKSSNGIFGGISFTSNLFSF